MDDFIEEEDLLDEDLEYAYGSKKRLDEDVDNGDLDAEDALFFEGYQGEDEED